ncbi:MAG: pyridoxal phosphate-dependent aminotransferase, partial [Erysipelotrichaceae bacterium]|nr:pyridoxal phosphate-dependent aminotransferase [Erysipelotrichaceae bacterium]
AQKEGVIPLTAADPDYPCPPAVKEALMEYISDGYFSYTPKTGLPEFRESVSRYIKKKRNEDVKPENIVAVDSAARAMFTIAKAFLQPGDEMIVFDPCDFLFRESCKSAGATPVFFTAAMDPETRKMDLSGLEDCVSEKTKMIGLCNPHNPYGISYTKEQLDDIMTICEKHDLLIMNDEIWSDILYTDNEFNSIYCLGNDRCQRVLSLFGYSKSFGLAGLRIGAMYATDDEKFRKLVAASDVLTTAGGATSLSQIAAVAAMDHSDDWSAQFRKHLEENRNYAVDFINNHIPGLKAYRPQATYLLFVDMSALKMKSVEFVNYLLEEEQLAVVPGGHDFFGDQSEGHFRICIATSREILEEGLKRLQ